MPTYHLRGLTSDLITAATQRARDAGTSLDDVLRAYLTAYAAGTTAQHAGGHARAAALSPARRSTISRQAALARWRQR